MSPRAAAASNESRVIVAGWSVRSMPSMRSVMVATLERGPDTYISGFVVDSFPGDLGAVLNLSSRFSPSATTDHPLPPE